MNKVFFVLAAVCFALGALGVGRLNWANAGFCCLVIALWLV